MTLPRHGWISNNHYYQHSNCAMFLGRTTCGDTQCKALIFDTVIRVWKRCRFFLNVFHVRNEKVLLQVIEQRNILHAIRKRKANWIGHILRRNCLLKQVIEGKIKGEIELIRRQRGRRKKLLDDLKDRRGCCHLKEEALDRNMWRERFGRGFEHVFRQNTGWWWVPDD